MGGAGRWRVGVSMAGGWPQLVTDLLPQCDFPPAGVVLDCAVSGGADSLALLVLAAAAGCAVTASSTGDMVPRPFGSGAVSPA